MTRHHITPTSRDNPWTALRAVFSTTASRGLAWVRVPKLAQRWLENAALCQPAGGPTETGVMLFWLASIGVGMVGGLTLGNWVWGMVGTFAGAALPVIYLMLRQGERNRRLAQVLPDFLESLARSLRSGSSLQTATVEAIDGPPSLPWPLPQELAKLRAELSGGIPFRESIATWQRQRPLRPVTLTAAALLLCAGVGGEKARSIDAVAQTLREQNAVQQELWASSTQARMSAIVIALLPLAFLVLTTAAGASSENLLWGNSFGLLCLAGGVVLNITGGLWIRRILHGTLT